MKSLIMQKAKGLKHSLSRFFTKVSGFDVTGASIGHFIDLVSDQMKELSFDTVSIDRAGNLVGVIKGRAGKDKLVMLSHADIITPANQRMEGASVSGPERFKAGIVSSVYAGALIKNAMVPLTGDLIICCVPRTESCDFGIKYLFRGISKPKAKKIKGVVLCEPTGFNINLGHKGRMEYEIVVKGRLNRNFLENRGMNMLGTMFPLINELEKVSKDLPSDLNLGRSGLRIKDVSYSGYRPQDELNEFRIVVDRVFIPEEEKAYILDKAKSIAKNVYKGEPDVIINTALAKERIKTHTGMELVSEKEFKPWSMESHNPFAAGSLKCLVENGFKSDFGFWKKVVTEGSYTYANLKIPTIGFGAGSEDAGDPSAGPLTDDKVERAAYGQALIVQRSIGVPAFGWSSDEI